jgi:phosphoenolpyruvate carboxykinase (ATP)
MEFIMGQDFAIEAKTIFRNPSSQELRTWVSNMPNARKTQFDNFNVEINVKARSKASTYIVSDTENTHSDQTMSRSDYLKVAEIQNRYISDTDMIVVDGYIGADPETRTAVTLYVEKANPNIAAMQTQLYFTPTRDELATFKPDIHVVYTPNLPMPTYPNERLIAVDLEGAVTRVFNSDYFGESKKAGLRIWNQLVYDRGGLALHAGCKEIPVNGKRKICLIIGLSGTGKTTTTFSRQNGSRPIQDDFIAWLADGSVIGSENGCFAKTFGLDAENEPMIYQAVCHPDAYLENVSINDKGEADFFDDSYTQNGRATFPLDLISEIGNVKSIPQVDYVLILNRNDNLIPAVARLDKQQAAAYFMLGETQGTSAGGVEEAGKPMRVPGTNPFFPGLHGHQGTRFLELLTASDAQVFLMNTGWVGGPDGNPHSRKVKIKHSSAVVQAIVDNTINWEKDHDFGYELATEIPGFTNGDHYLLQPRRYYSDTDRRGYYEEIVHQLKQERHLHLQNFPGLAPEIIRALS